jgi:hypothetical protein
MLNRVRDMRCGSGQSRASGIFEGMQVLRVGAARRTGPHGIFRTVTVRTTSITGCNQCQPAAIANTASSLRYPQ